MAEVEFTTKDEQRLLDLLQKEKGGAGLEEAEDEEAEELLVKMMAAGRTDIAEKLGVSFAGRAEHVM
ncbi:MAG: hypothetical protein WCT36_04260 [Candidatus Gracilibacteria bacterium]|jgi:hypothetical protein